jgi:hypothetical protein
MSDPRALPALATFTALLTACNSLSGSPQVAPTSVLTKTRTAARPLADVLYVANTGIYGPASVTVYGGSKQNLLRTITDGVQSPVSLTLNPSGHLYVANDNTVTVYVNQGRKLRRTISRRLRSPFQVALDSSGNLYVLRFQKVTVYVSGTQHIMHNIKVMGYSLALDASNNLYVGTRNNTVNVYPPGSTTPSRTISDGIVTPAALAFDTAGNLYVANTFGGSEYCGKILGGTVTVYAPGNGSPLYTISPSQGICTPFRLALDSSGNLYVANGPPGAEEPSSVTVYVSGSNTLMRTITQGVNGPQAVTLDHSDNLYVANSTGEDVTVYAPGSTSVLQTISNGISYPESLAIGK